MKRLILPALATLLFASCASSVQPSSATNPQQVVCTREKQTGSHRSTRVCQTVAQKEAAREDARKAMDGRRGLNEKGGG